VPDSREEGLIDLALVRRSAQGDREAFDTLLARHQASVFRLARYLTGNQDQAEDVLQQTFLSAWQGAAGFRGESSIRTWLLTIARNAALTRRKQAAREPIDETRSKTSVFAPGGVVPIPSNWRLPLSNGIVWLSPWQAWCRKSARS